MVPSPNALGPTICIGEILAEIVATTIGDGFAEPSPLIGPYPSGAPAIFIDQCGRMGGAAAMIGAVGDDDFGRMNLDRLKRVTASMCRRFPSIPPCPPARLLCAIAPTGERNFVFNMWTSAAGRLNWTQAIDTMVNSAGHLHVMGTLLSNGTIWPLVERAANVVKERGGSISLDPNMRKELRVDAEADARAATIIAMTDLLLPSGDELFVAARLSPSLGEARALEHLFDLGISEIVVKRGASGSSCYQADGMITHAPALRRGRNRSDRRR